MRREQIIELVNEAKLGSEDAFNKLLQEFQPIIQKYVRKYSYYTRDGPEDLFQLASLSLWDATRTYSDRNPSFYLYARTLIIRALTVHVRNEKKRVNMLYGSASWENDHLEDLFVLQCRDVVDDIDTKDRVWQVMEVASRGLNPKEKEIFTLYFIEDMSVRNIADYYQINYSAASQRVRRTIKKVKALLKEEGIYEEAASSSGRKGTG